MTRERKIAKARKLRDEGLTYPAIAKRLGVHKKTVRRWLNPEEAEADRQASLVAKKRRRDDLRAYNREYDRTHRAACPRCGQEMGRATGRRGGICQNCRSDEVDRRARQIEQLWAEGLTMREIADRLGWTPGHLSAEMDRLRAKGYDLPYRHSVHRTPSGKPRFPEQVPA